MALNPYINSFDTEADYDEYLDGSTAKAPNVAYIKATDTMKYTKTVPNPTWIIYGTTTGTTDFYVGAQGRYNKSSASNGIHMHVQEGVFYATAEDVVGDIKYLNSDYSGFSNTEGKKITKLKRWAYPNTDVIGTSNMFRKCTSLTSLDLSGFDTSNVTDMSSMFSDCSSLTSLDLSGFDTSNVTDMGSMFWGCTNLTTLDISSFDTTKVTNMVSMFTGAAINKLILGPGFFNSTSLSSFDFVILSAWTDADSLETFVQAAEVHDGTGKTIQLSSYTKDALTQGQKDRLTGAGWTIG